MSWLATERGRELGSYEELWRWSVSDLEGFWGSIADFFAIRFRAPYERVLADRTMPGASWFPGARLNYAEHLIGADDDRDRIAVLARSQTRPPIELTFGELREQAARVRAGLAAARRRPRRPRRRVPAEHPRDADRVHRHRQPRRDLGGVRARVRRAQRDRPLRADRAARAAGGGRLRLPRPLRRPPRRGGGDPRAPYVPRARRIDPLRRRRAPGHARLGRAARRAGAARVRAGRVRPPAVRAVLLGYDRPAEGDRPRPRRTAARAPQEPGARLGPEARWPACSGLRRPRG